MPARVGLRAELVGGGSAAVLAGVGLRASAGEGEDVERLGLGLDEAGRLGVNLGASPGKVVSALEFCWVL